MFGEEDLRQCAALALFKAAQTYDEGKEVSFGLYAKICVNNALISTLRKYKTEQKRQRRAKERENKAPADPIAALINAEDDERLKAKIKTELSDFEKVYSTYILMTSPLEKSLRYSDAKKSPSATHCTA